MRTLRLSIAAALALTACSEDGGQLPNPNPDLEITTPALGDGVLDEAYSAQITATGGSGEGYTWRVAAGALPPGLSIVSEGTPSTMLSGTPSEEGVFNFSVEVADSAGEKEDRSFRIAIIAAGDPLAITTQSLPRAEEGRGYSAELRARDGSGAGYAWSIAAGALPAGLALAADGTPATTITGTASEDGNFTFTVRVEDSAGGSAEQVFMLEVAPAPPPELAIDTRVIGGGFVGRAYSADITASGGTEDGYTWSLVSGDLPPGLTVAASGTPSTTIDGVPTNEGTYNFTLEVMDSGAATATQAYSVVIGRSPSTLVIFATNLADGTEGTPYTATIEAAGGSQMGYQWDLSEGALPAGLTLAASGTPGTTISGTPSEDGDFTFTVRVRDSQGNEGTRPMTLRIVASIPPIQILTTSVPNGAVGVPYNVTIETVPGTGSGMNYGWIISAGVLPPGLALTAMSSPSTQISGTPTGGGVFPVTITVYDADNTTDSQDFVFDIFQPLTITTATLPGGQTGTPYSATVTGFGGSGSGYTWSIVQGALPAGLTITATGTPEATISGTPSVGGDHTFTVEARDDNGGVATRELTISVVTGLTVTTVAVPPGRIGQAYSAPIDAIGGTGTGYAWALTAGTLPMGLTLAPSGTPGTTISGTPGEHGTFPVTVSVTDSGASNASVDLMIEIAAGERWLAYVGDTTVDTRNDVVLFGIPGLAPVGQVILNPPVATGSAPTTDGSTQFSPDGTKIAFRGDFTTDGLNELYVVDVTTDTPGAPQIVNGPNVAGGGVVAFVWSADSSRIVYSAEQDTDGVIELYMTDVSGPVPAGNTKLSGPMQTTGDIVAGAFDFSPDGGWVAYLADQDTEGVNELYLVDVRGALPGPATRAHPGLPSAADIEHPWVWTPDGARLIYAGDQETTDVVEVFMIDLTGAVPSVAVKLNAPLVSGGDVGIAVTDIGVSFDGALVSYVADQDTDAVEEVYVVDISGPTPSTPVKVSGAAQSFTDNINVRWSPVARKLAYSSDEAATSVYDVYFVDLTGPTPATPVRIHPPLPSFGRLAAGEEAIQWSSDGNRIAYRSDTVVDNAFQIEVVDVSVSPPSAPLVVVLPRTTGLTTDAFLFSPDGTKIAARGEGMADNLDELFVTALTGPNFGVVTSMTGVPTISGAQVTDMVWAGDSRHILIRSDFFVDGRFEAFLIDTDAPVYPPVPLVPVLPAGGNVGAVVTGQR